MNSSSFFIIQHLKGISHFVLYYLDANTKLMEDNRNEGRREGRNEGRREGRNEGNLEKTKTVVRNMLDRGYEIEDICAIAGCEASFVEEVRKDLLLQ